VSALLLSLLAAALGARGVVYDDANANGRRDRAERGLARVVVTDGIGLALTEADGAYALPPSTARRVFVVVPGDRRAVGPWHRPPSEAADFALARDPAPAVWRFAHLSDTHVHEGNAPRLRAALALAAARARLAVVSGDLIKDALRVGEHAARAQYALYAEAVAGAGLEVRSAPGNHEVFGIERAESGVSADHPLYGKGMYEEVLGPRYYSFNRGRLHFIVLDTVGVDDQWYYGFLDADQLAWIRRDLEHVPPGASVVTLGHIPLRNGALSREFAAEGPARTVMAVGGAPGFRHLVRNAGELAALLRPFDWTLALQGHTHMGERLRFEDGTPTRFHTAPAVDGQPWAPWPTGIVVYTVRGSAVDDGRFFRTE
jgi:hypothetical protein